MNIQLPNVSRKDGYEPFDRDKIYTSLSKETTLSYGDAAFIADKVTRFIFANNLKFLSGPLIREIVNVKLLEFGFEKQRLEYTRIGLPYYDFKKLNKYVMLRNESEIYQRILKEFEAVKKLIEEREEKEC